MAYAWIIGRDEPEPAEDATARPATASRTGPHDAPEELLSLLRRGIAPDQEIGSLGVYRLQMGTQDRTRYTGRLITDDGPTTEACFGPLGDYGLPRAGCTVLRYPGHPELDCQAAEADQPITITMIETVSYRRTFTVADLAALLDTPPVRREVLAALDTANSEYGTRAEAEEALLDALVVPAAPARYLLGVTDRAWTVSDSGTR